MKAKSRKHLLISSIAMLLVAAVALGAATYAWFTSSTTATASGINVKTIQSSELVISKSDKNWQTQVDYNTGERVLQPTSTANGVSWFTANAETKGNFAKPSGENFSPIDATPENYYFVEQLNIANKGAADVENVTITISGLTNDYVRVALVPANESGTATGTFKECVYDNAGLAYDAASAADSTTEITPKNTTTINVGTLTGKTGDDEMGQAVYYNLYVWFEGQDVQCIDANAGQSVPDLTFTISGTTAEQQSP